MKTEKQIRLNFLDEAEDCFDLIESHLLGLANAAVDGQQVDLMLRAAHSVKGGAGMMEFPILSRAAHRLEDFFKILRVRYASSSLNTEVETLLLQSVDSLRQISTLLRQEVPIQEDWLKEQIDPVFEGLRQHLGDLQESDEDALIAQEEEVDPALLMFEEGVDAVLDRLESHLEQMDHPQLAQELVATAEELAAFGRMANLDPFIKLSEQIQRQGQSLSTQEVASLATDALSTWRRSHALVVRGRLEQLPSRLQGTEGDAQETSFPETEAPPDIAEDDILSLLDGLESLDCSNIEAEANLKESEAVSMANLPPDIAADVDLLLDDPLELEELTDLQAAFDIEVPEATTAVDSQPKQTEIDLTATPQALQRQQVPSISKMVRVPLEQLRQFNNLFEKLVLERNTVNLRLKQLQNYSALMRERMQQIEQSNTQLKQWYDRASLEGILTTTDTQRQPFLSAESPQAQFDALEMDRYSDLHLICQEQIETIVQLQEVTTDIDLGLLEMNQAVRDLNQTTKSLQGNVTRTQMLPFAEVVKRFPRLVRDLNLQFGKQVELKIDGENTLIDRSVLETLSDPLMHLLRNAFDHGIEAPEARVAALKPPTGTITLTATNQGTHTVITLADDGGGISVDKIRDRLCRLGLPETYVNQMSVAELLDYIFEPGFSTANQVTELSGRGVGMDVVRSNLQKIRGDIQVQTQPGVGTTFTLRIPFTLSILRVIIVERAGIPFAVPVDSVRQILRLQSDQVITQENTLQLTWNNQEIPLLRLEDSLLLRRPNHSFHLSGNPAIERPMVLVVGNATKVAGVQIDRFWGEQEATIRPIETLLPLPPGFGSAIALGNGQIIPLVEPMALVEAGLSLDSDKIISAARDSQVSLSPTQTKTILVVDDSITVRRYLSLTLERAGYKVEQAKDGREAVDKLVGGLSVQAVICDIEMPRLDGYGVLEEVKGDSRFQDLPIAMLTSRSNEKHRKLAMNLGASAYFSKPYNEQQLLQTLAELI